MSRNSLIGWMLAVCFIALIPTVGATQTAAVKDLRAALNTMVSQANLIFHNMNTFDDPSVTVEPQPVVSPARAACLPPTMTFELPEVIALPAGHGGACPLWSPASAGPATMISTAARA